MRAIVIGAPYEATASFVGGCALGPDAVAEALDALWGSDLAPVGRAEAAPISWIEAHERTVTDPAEMIRSVARVVRETRAAGCFPIVVGGEHTVTAGAIEAEAEPESLTVVQFDAHADLRAQYEGTAWSHACAMRRVLDRGSALVQIGVRSACIEEIRDVYGDAADGSAGLIEAPRARLLTRSALRDRSLDSVRPSPRDRIWITVDLDVLDPSAAPGVGTPEPDGLSFDELVAALDAIRLDRVVVGADIVELCPPRDDGRTAVLAARLVRLLAGTPRPPGGRG